MVLCRVASSRQESHDNRAAALENVALIAFKHAQDSLQPAVKAESWLLCEPACSDQLPAGPQEEVVSFTHHCAGAATGHFTYPARPPMHT